MLVARSYGHCATSSDPVDNTGGSYADKGRPSSLQRWCAHQMPLPYSFAYAERTCSTCATTLAGCDVKARLASCLKQDGFRVSDYLSGNFKDATGSFIDADRIWERAARAAADIKGDGPNGGTKRTHDQGATRLLTLPAPLLAHLGAHMLGSLSLSLCSHRHACLWNGTGGLGLIICWKDDCPAQAAGQCYLRVTVIAAALTNARDSVCDARKVYARTRESKATAAALRDCACTNVW